MKDEFAEPEPPPEPTQSFWAKIGLPEPEMGFAGSLKGPIPGYKGYEANPGFDINTAIPSPGSKGPVLQPALAAKTSPIGQRTAPTDASKAPKIGPPREIGSVTLEGTPPPDPNDMKAWIKFRTADAQLEMVQNQTRSIALGIESQLNESFAYGLQNNYEATHAKITGLLDQAEQELFAFDDMVQKARSGEINQGQFFANTGDAGKFAAAIAVGAGAMASAFGGGENIAYSIISRAIDRNVRAQVVNQQHNRALLGHQMNYVNGIRGLAGDQANLGNITRAALTGIVQAQIEQSRAASGSQFYQVQAQRVTQQFGADMAEASIKARQNIKFKYQMKFHSEAQADRRTAVAQLAMQNAIGRATGAPPPVAASRRRQARPAQVEPGAAPPPAVVQGGPPSAPQLGPPAVAQASPPAAAQDTAAQTAEERFVGDKPAKEQAKIIARKFQEDASVQRASDDLPTREEIDALWKDVDPTGQSPLAQALRSLPDSAFTPVRSRASVAVHTSGFGTRYLQVRNPEEWEKLGGARQDEIQKQLGKKMATEAMLREMYDMVGMMSRGKGLLGDFMRRGRNGELVFPLFASGSDTELISRLNLVADRIANLKRTEVGPDAIRALAEWDLWLKLAAGGEITKRQQVVDVLRNDSKVRQDKIKPYLDFEREDILNVAVPYFTNFD